MPKYQLNDAMLLAKLREILQSIGSHARATEVHVVLTEMLDPLHVRFRYSNALFSFLEKALLRPSVTGDTL